MEQISLPKGPKSGLFGANQVSFARHHPDRQNPTGSGLDLLNGWS
jgi:hypothetical protein